MTEWRGVEAEALAWVEAQGTLLPDTDATSLAVLLRRAVAHGYRLAGADVYVDPRFDPEGRADAIERGEVDA